MMAALHVSSSISDPLSLPVSDKSMHGASFAVLALLALRALAGGNWRGVTRWTLLGCCLIAVMYGVKDEWQQSYTPGRVADVMDLVADLTGAVSAAIAAGAWSIIRRL